MKIYIEICHVKTFNLDFNHMNVDFMCFIPIVYVVSCVNNIFKSNNRSS